MRRSLGWIVALGAMSVACALLGLAIGPVPIPFAEVWRALIGTSTDADVTTIVRQVRLPEVLTAGVAGAGLAASGLVMQTIFRNPLAGPSVLGISSGASLGVALVLLLPPTLFVAPIPREALSIVAALAGALGVLVLIVLADRRVGDGITLLIIGLMVGYLCSAVISVLQTASLAQSLKGYVLWGMGSFAGMDLPRLPWLVVPVIAGLVVAHVLIKPLDALLLGETYAQSLGVHVLRTRRLAIWTTGVLAGTITAFCGPVSFLGLATPHIARALVRTNAHGVLMPVSMLLGAVLAIGCDLVVRAPGYAAALPLNAVTSLLGAPVVLWVLLSGRRWARSSTA
ncbi:MAG: iron ABC transporter permease [Bacteroidetes bacterium]|nr:iron ABC transporter permease [Bacteroidota bacterium]